MNSNPENGENKLPLKIHNYRYLPNEVFMNTSVYSIVMLVPFTQAEVR